MKTQESLLSYYYCCQQKKALFVKRFEESHSVEERHYWIKQMNKNDLELDAIKNLLSDYRPQALPEIQDQAPQYRI